jgi:hypothetical protein
MLVAIITLVPYNSPLPVVSTHYLYHQLARCTPFIHHALDQDGCIIPRIGLFCT